MRYFIGREEQAPPLPKFCKAFPQPLKLRLVQTKALTPGELPTESGERASFARFTLSVGFAATSPKGRGFSLSCGRSRMRAFEGSEQAPSGQKHRSPRSLPRDRFSLFFPFSPSLPRPPDALGLEPPTEILQSVPSPADGTMCANSLLAFLAREGHLLLISPADGTGIRRGETRGCKGV